VPCLGLGLTFVLAATGVATAAEVPVIPVAVTATACEPMELKVAAGKVTFVVTNRSSRALEWEILKGVMVVDERENIAPGFKSRLTTTLEPGTYDITCGLLDNPRGRLIVTGAASAVSPADLAGAIAEYRVGNARILAELDAALGRLAAAGSDRAAAGAAFLEARGRLAAVAPLRDEVGAAATVVAADAVDLDRLLFDEGAGDPGPLAAKFVADARAFAALARPLVVPADRLVGSAQRSARDLPALLEGPASPTLLARAEAERAAIERVSVLFAPLWARADEAGARALAEASARLEAELAVAGPIGRHADARTLAAETRRAQVAAARDFAERFAALAAGLGL
jgi:hypothetical protein